MDGQHDAESDPRPPSATAVVPPQPDPAPPIDPARRAGGTLATAKIPLGEELPVFCERCGYSLHGLPQDVCGHCTVRQFHCPECGHHQPINTLRPAFQKTLGRVRAFLLTISVLIKLNFFGWLLFLWVIAGYETSYEYQDNQTYSNRVAVNGPGGARYLQRNARPTFVPRDYDMDQVLGLSLFALAFGMVGRMLLLRWRRGYLVGLALSVLVCLAIAIGAYWCRWSRTGDGEALLPSPLSPQFLGLLALLAVTLTLGTTIVWGIWMALAHVFLPRRTSEALLNWQRSLSNPPAAQLARE